MKIYVRTAIFLLITFISLNVYAKDKDKLLIGKWKGIDNHSHFGELIFEKSQYAFFKIEDELYGGKDFIFRDIPAECKYEIDKSKNPIWLDIVIFDKKQKQEIVRIKGILNFINNDRIQYRINMEGNRHSGFDPNSLEDTIILDRVKD